MLAMTGSSGSSQSLMDLISDTEALVLANALNSNSMQATNIESRYLDPRSDLHE